MFHVPESPHSRLAPEVTGPEQVLFWEVQPVLPGPGELGSVSSLVRNCFAAKMRQGGIMWDPCPLFLPRASVWG